ncbi:MAG: adenylate/guanylate cyclase domain-containing protein [Gammaproteobacteria bacterium]
MRFQFRSFRARLFAFVVGLLVLMHGAVLLSVHAANLRGARSQIDEALELTAAAFRRSLRVREQILVEKARLLSSDYAFKQVAATKDPATIRSALENHSARVGADAMLLLDLSGDVVADTLRLEPGACAPARRALVAAAMNDEFGEASSIQPLGDTPYQLVIVPLFTPEPSAWIAIGFAVDDRFALELQQETRTQVSLLRRGPAGWYAFCTTLAEPARRELERQLPDAMPAKARSLSFAIAGNEYVSWIEAIEEGGIPVLAVLQRSLDEALQPFFKLRAMLLLIFGAGIALSLLLSVLLAARVTRPVAELARGARRIGEGNYVDPVEVKQRDEFGALAASFNHMMKGLVERDQVRDMLGRVVSPQIAEELLRKEIELGGKERIVSVLFTDIRGFMTVAEREQPERLVKILNTFLTGVSAAIERHGGVVEEYMGDGAKALFGAPLEHEDDARRALLAALELQKSLPRINAEVERIGGSPLAIGIGIHTGPVVAGKMGSLARLKYTVVGDGVNLASRLEGLTRLYGVTIIASESTREACPGFVFRELDRVRVKGRDSPVVIYEPIGPVSEVGSAILERLEIHRAALERFRARDWDGARARFSELLKGEPSACLYQFFLERIATLRRDPPGPEWDGTLTHREK